MPFNGDFSFVSTNIVMFGSTLDLLQTKETFYGLTSNKGDRGIFCNIPLRLMGSVTIVLLTFFVSRLVTSITGSLSNRLI